MGKAKHTESCAEELVNMETSKERGAGPGRKVSFKHMGLILGHVVFAMN